MPGYSTHFFTYLPIFLTAGYHIAIECLGFSSFHESYLLLMQKFVH